MADNEMKHWTRLACGLFSTVVSEPQREAARWVFLAQERCGHAGENDTELFPGTHPPGNLPEVAG